MLLSVILPHTADRVIPKAGAVEREIMREFRCGDLIDGQAPGFVREYLDVGAERMDRRFIHQHDGPARILRPHGCVACQQGAKRHHQRQGAPQNR
jgi:hypothetical protein